MNKKSLAMSLLCMAVFPQLALAAAPAFHRAGTEPEKALDAILMQEKTDNGMNGYLTHDTAGKNDAAYASMFTSAFKKAVAKADVTAAKKECGKNTSGDQCGLEFSPVTCAQDTTDTYYLYHIVATGKKTATISYAWPGEKEASATYKLVKEDGKWKIDGVRCGADGHAKFNMK